MGLDAGVALIWGIKVSNKQVKEMLTKLIGEEALDDWDDVYRVPIEGRYSMETAFGTSEERSFFLQIGTELQYIEAVRETTPPKIVVPPSAEQVTEFLSYLQKHDISTDGYGMWVVAMVSC